MAEKPEKGQLRDASFVRGAALVWSVDVFFFPEITLDDFSGLLDGHIAGVQAQVIIRSGVPGLTGVIIVILTALFVRIPDSFDGGVPLQGEGAHHPMDLAFGISAYEDLDDMIVVLQNVIRTASDDHTGLVLRQLPDQFRLEAEQIIRGYDVLSQGRLLVLRVQILDKLVQKIVAGTFIVHMEKLLQNAASVGNHTENILVVVGDLKFFGKSLRDMRSARPAFTSQCNRKFFSHVHHPFVEIL